MSKAIHATEFFVVGGPVQPDRASYVERAADGALMAAVRTRNLCCVLGARGIGKSSLMYRVARRLRDAGDLVAIVDLVQIGVLAERGSGRGWGLGFAERVARELGLDADVGPWWRTSKTPESERLAEFFWRVVLANTTARVTVFIDGLGGTAAEPPFLRELLATVEACYARRSSEPDFRRLCFVLVGSVSRRALSGGERATPLAAADVIELDDFSAAESYTLAAGFGDEQAIAQALMDRVTVWTGGHPYLTQKVARGVLRKGGKLEDVERVVHEQLLTPGAADSDPLLNHTRAWLTAKAPGARRAAKLLRRLARGGRVTAPADPAVQERLQLSGVVAIDGERRLSFRNRIFRELVGQWVRSAGSGLRLAVAALLLLLLTAAAGYWYVQYLPTADVATLESATADLAGIDTAYQRLHALPGFAERAETLFAAALQKRSAAARTVTEVATIDSRLRVLPGQEETADRLFAAFWLRRAAQAANAEQRDAALLFAARAAQLPNAPASANGTLEELVAADYPHLERTLHLPARPVAWRMQFAESTVAALDTNRQLQRAPFGEQAASGAAGNAPVRLTALQHVSASRELTVDGDGTAGMFELVLHLVHPASAELLVTLTAPGGEQAAVVPQGDGDGAAGTFTFDAVRGTPLGALTDASRRGVWRLTLVDRRAENAGVLAGWELRFGADAFRDEPEEPVAIPDPLRTDAVTVAIDGDFALVRPQTNGAIGTVALWNVASGGLVNDFALPMVPNALAVNGAGNRLVAATEKVVTVFSTNDGRLVSRPQTDTEFVLPPVFSSDGGYFAIAERVEEGKPLYSVLRANDGSLVASFEGMADVQRWWLGPGARYLALQLPDRSLHVLGGRRGETLLTLPRRGDSARVLPLADGTTLLTIAARGAIEAWSLAPGAPPQPRRLGTTVAAASVSLAAGGKRLAFEARDAAIVVVDAASGAEVARLRGAGVAFAGRQLADDGALPSATTQLADDGEKLVTASGAQLRLWSLPARTQAGAARSVEPTALALDRDTGRLAIGLADGRLALDAIAAAAPATLEYVGHRGAVTAVAVNVAHGLAVTGGADGVVRVWELTSGMPSMLDTEPAAAAVGALALTNDAQLVASAAAKHVRVARAADGSTVFERDLGAAVTALAFAPDGARLAIGDAGGTVTVARMESGAQTVSLQTTGAITAFAFDGDGTRLAIADDAGAVHLVRAADAAAIGAPRNFPQPVRWLAFAADGSALLLATVDWLHALRADATLEPLASRFAPHPLASSALAAGNGLDVRYADVGPDGAASVTPFDLAAAPAASAAPAARDWPAALGVRLDDAGEPAPFDP